MQLTDTHRAYAQLLLDTGINLQPGMNVVLGGEPIHWPFLNLLAEEAYKAGARFVAIEANHPGAAKARVDHCREEFLSYIPAYAETRIAEIASGEWARLAICGSEAPDLLANIDQQRNAIIQKANRKVAKPLMDACGAGRIPWCVAALPTPEWAAKVMQCEASDDAAEALWQVMLPILRLDREDPKDAWRENSALTEKRGIALTSANFEVFHFKGPGTDLKVYSNAEHLWEGGDLTSDAGHAFIPNIPTEEIFTTPDWRRTSGRAAVTRPVEVLGANVANAWFEFEAGRVVDYGASEGKEKLDAYFEIDEQARYLGEVALVDSSSPIFQSGRIFHNILYDENAACHIALGSGYPTGVKGGVDMNDEEKSAAGINQSILHTDFMIGSEEVDVIGIAADGTETPIIRSGSFTGIFS